jgi:tRNA threonylcarbamoyladenosine biosynthesis protein TsaE
MSCSLDLISSSPEATEKIGLCLAPLLRPGDILTLDGDMGAGKTALTRGLAKGMGHEQGVASPTFTIVMEHPAEHEGQLSLFHFDVYRLRNSDDFLDSGLDEYLYRDGVSVLEWANIVEDALPQNRLKILIRGSGEEREFVFCFPPDRCKELEQMYHELLIETDIHFPKGGVVC